MAEEKDKMTRRDFIKAGACGAACFALGAGLGSLGERGAKQDMVWQIDPGKCIQCGNCETHCVLKPSAVKCVHAFGVCGYCERCFGFFAAKPAEYTSGAENELCPAAALTRKHVKGQYHEYTVDEEKCIACGRCVKGCRVQGNSSLFLQVRHDRCLNCSQCSIAEACPSHAFVRVPASTPYIRPKIKPSDAQPRDKAS